MWVYYTSDELYHHGILGMKWGVHRSRSSTGESSSGSRRHKKAPVEINEDYARAHSKKSVKSMSNAELKQRIQRLNDEKQYAQLNPSKVQQGWRKAAKLVGAMGTASALYAGGKKMVGIGKEVADKYDMSEKIGEFMFKTSMR